MIFDFIIGHIGADAEVKTSNGQEFTTFRIANTERWKDEQGNVRENTEWVDCIMSGRPNVLQWLKRGQLVSVIGTSRLRVYSSKKDRCMKAGRTISVVRLELVGSSNNDAVPKVLYDENGVQHDVTKWYLTNAKKCTLMSSRGEQFNVDGKGWVTPVVVQEEARDEIF